MGRLAIFLLLVLLLPSQAGCLAPGPGADLVRWPAEDWLHYCSVDGSEADSCSPGEPSYFMSVRVSQAAPYEVEMRDLRSEPAEGDAVYSYATGLMTFRDSLVPDADGTWAEGFTVGLGAAVHSFQHLLVASLLFFDDGEWVAGEHELMGVVRGSGPSARPVVGFETWVEQGEQEWSSADMVLDDGAWPPRRVSWSSSLLAEPGVRTIARMPVADVLRGPVDGPDVAPWTAGSERFTRAPTVTASGGVGRDLEEVLMAGSRDPRVLLWMQDHAAWRVHAFSLVQGPGQEEWSLTLGEDCALLQVRVQYVQGIPVVREAAQGEDCAAAVAVDAAGGTLVPSLAQLHGLASTLGVRPEALRRVVFEAPAADRPGPEVAPGIVAHRGARWLLEYQDGDQADAQGRPLQMSLSTGLPDGTLALWARDH